MTHAAIMRNVVAELAEKGERTARNAGHPSGHEAGRQAIAKLFFWI
jgi:hypothetical protein